MRRRVSRPDPPATDPADLETTAELPAPGRQGLAAPRGPSELSSTDTWVVPESSLLRAVGPPGEVQAAQREAAQVELERAHTERAAALERVEQLERELAQWRSGLEGARTPIEASERHSAPAGNPPASAAPLARRLAERDRALQAAERQLDALQRELSAHHEALSTVEGRRTVLDSLLRALQTELAEREAQVARLEEQIQVKNALLKTAQTGASSERAPDNADRAFCRVLLRLDVPDEAAHVLGHRTRIGRMPDNDLRLGARFVSRHHAMILTSGEQTIVEDLGSTNGVLVNGRRVARENLRDGDEITLGLARFRFLLRGIV